MNRRPRRRIGATAVVVGLWLALFIPSAGAALPPNALDRLRHLVIQDHGREKPFDSVARETLQRITGAPRYGAEDPVESVLAMMASPEPWQAKPLVWVPFVPLREALGMAPRQSHISYHALVATRTLMRMLPPIVQKEQRDEKLTMVEQETMDVFQRFVALSGLLEQKLALVPPPGAGIREWQLIGSLSGYPQRTQETVRSAWTELIAAVRAGRQDAINPAARHVSDVLHELNPAAFPPSWKMRLEVCYNRVGPFRMARLIYVLAALWLLLSLVSRWASIATPIGLGAYWAACLLHGAGIAMRVIIGGRPPVSNFFETTLWLPFVAVVIGLIVERFARVRYVALAAAILAAIALALGEQLPLDSSITPVVAVLRSNLWLTVHVLTIVASYGALALAAALAHVYGWLYLLRRGRHPALKSLDAILYRVLQIGVALLAGGIMLGAVWANASWGRYWGWDPKETWALITLLWFLAILHGRFAQWLSGIGVALAIIGGFFLLFMTYYGVSFYLVGLHSYAGGHAKPLPVLLIVSVVVELAFMGVVGVAALSRRLRASSPSSRSPRASG
ncbi:MAG: cytochrome c biogenesis protein CcsA [Candidatus Omnitrophica bacterium]|nr:cytochrome c biogenesis protein CcsA [Candidatus Omnitrophota bacterium]